MKWPPHDWSALEQRLISFWESQGDERWKPQPHKYNQPLLDVGMDRHNTHRYLRRRGGMKRLAAMSEDARTLMLKPFRKRNDA
jgi:hypothetical protein